MNIIILFFQILKKNYAILSNLSLKLFEKNQLKSEKQKYTIYIKKHKYNLCKKSKNYNITNIK